jgi:hypothetical protein
MISPDDRFKRQIAAASQPSSPKEEVGAAVQFGLESGPEPEPLRQHEPDRLSRRDLRCRV